MEVTKLQLEQLASHIVRDLKCGCNLTYSESRNQPCLCGWTHISDWFEDEFDMELKDYPDAMKLFYDDYFMGM